MADDKDMDKVNDMLKQQGMDPERVDKSEKKEIAEDMDMDKDKE